MEKDKRDIVRLQVTLGCNKDCEGCSKFFDCTSPLKQDIYNSAIHKRIDKKLETVKYKIAVMSGKGGVGKSTTTANLAAAFNLLGAKVGILDSDFYGPSIPTIMGVGSSKLTVRSDGIVPVLSSNGIEVASVASTLKDTEYVTWMGDQIRWALYQFLGGTTWSKLDFLLIDLPPGTGEETLNVMKAIRGLSGGVIVTIPSDVSQIVVGRGIMLCKKAGTAILGVVENMGTLICPKCQEDIDVFLSGGGVKIADQMDVPFLGTIPLDRRVAEASDAGEPFVSRYPDSEAAKSFIEIAKKICADLGFDRRLESEPALHQVPP